MRFRSKVVLGATGVVLVTGCSSLLGDYSLEVEGGGDGGVDATTANDAQPDQNVAPLDAGADSADTSAPIPDASGDAASPCDAGQISCSGACISSTELTNCGTCGHDCTHLPNVTGTVGCSAAGACVFDGGACQSGYGICSADPDKGCDTSFSQSSTCGGCATSCDAGAPFCEANDAGAYACSLNCGTKTRCGTSCYDTTSDPNHCGGCNTPCPPVDGGTPVCSGQKCTGVTCDSLYHQCPSSSGTNFCASNFDPSNCGSTCGSACPSPNGTGTGVPACNGTMCTVSCTNGSGQCTVSGVVGCYDFLNDNTNCGACGHLCKTPIGGAGTCSQGMCVGAKVAPVASSVGDMASDQGSVYWVDPGAQSAFEAAILASGTPFTLASAASVGGAGNNFYVDSIAATPWNGNTLIALTRYNNSKFVPELWVATPGKAAVLGGTLSNVTENAGGIAFNPSASAPTAWVETSANPTFQMYDAICVSSTSCATASGWTDISEGSQLSGTAGFNVVWGANAGSWAAFWTMKSAGTLYGNTIAIEKGETSPDSLATDGSYLYWVTGDTVNSSTATVQRLAIPNPSATSFAAPTALAITGATITVDSSVSRAGLASDGKYVYFSGTSSTGPGIYYAPVTGGAAAELVAVGQPSLVTIATLSSGRILLYADVKGAQGAIYEEPLAP